MNTKFTLSKAAEHLGMSKGTLSKALKKEGNSRLSAEKLADGSYQIDLSELDRWYSENGHRNAKKTRIETPENPPETSHDFKAIEAELKALREQLSSQQEERRRERDIYTDQIEDLRRRLDQESIDRRAKDQLLTDMRTEAEKRAAKRPGLLGWWKERKSA